MMKEFIQRGHRVVAIGNESEDDWRDRFAEEGIAYKKIEVSRNGTNPFEDIKTYRSIRRILKEVRPDKIFVYQAKTVIYGCLAAKSLGIKEVYPLLAGVGSVFLSDNKKSQFIRRILVAEYRTALKDVPCIFLQNNDDIKTYTWHGVLQKDQRVKLIPGSGVNTERFSVSPLPEKFTFLCISRLIRDKGVMEYLNACRIIKSLHPGVRCMLVGPFDSNPSAVKPEELKPYIDDGSIEFFGEQRDVKRYIDQCSVYVLPSYREGTPKTVLEAMACGRAIITTNAPGCRETVIDVKNGLLVPVKNVRALVDAMELFISDPELAKTMGKNSRKIAEDKLDVRIVNDMICEEMGF